MEQLTPTKLPKRDARATLQASAADRILVIDGAMGTMIQRRKLSEADYRGERFADWPRDLKGNNDLLNLTRPDIIREIHEEYLRAGADIVATNTFTSNRIVNQRTSVIAWMGTSANCSRPRAACTARLSRASR